MISTQYLRLCPFLECYEITLFRLLARLSKFTPHGTYSVDVPFLKTPASPDELW